MILDDCQPVTCHRPIAPALQVLYASRSDQRDGQHQHALAWALTAGARPVAEFGCSRYDDDRDDRSMEGINHHLDGRHCTQSGDDAHPRDVFQSCVRRVLPAVLINTLCANSNCNIMAHSKKEWKPVKSARDCGDVHLRASINGVSRGWSCQHAHARNGNNYWHRDIVHR